MKIICYQPHFDDAVWSIAEHLLTWKDQGHDLAVVTMCGWSGAEKENTLAAEHSNVLSKMGLYGWEHDLKDDAHTGPENRFEVAQAMADAVAADIQLEQPDVVVRPRGIHHPDHIDMAWAASAAYSIEQWVYDELPYYVLYPEIVRAMGRSWNQMKCEDHFTFKRYLCAMYESQWAPHLRRTVFAPERVWRVTR